MLVTLTLALSADECVDVRVGADGPVTLRQLMPQLSALQNPEGTCEPGPLDLKAPLDRRLGEPGLRTGCVLRLNGRPGRRDITASSLLCLKVLSGPDCGGVFPLRRGITVIGREVESDVTLADPELSRRQAEIGIGLHSLSIRDLSSTNGTVVAGQAVGTGCSTLMIGDRVRMGSSLLEVARVSDPPAATKPDGGGRILVQRPPHPLDAFTPSTHQLPAEPAFRPKPRGQWSVALLPMLLSVGMAVFMRSPQFLAFAALGPVTLLATTVSEKRAWRRSCRDDRTAHRNALGRMTDLLRTELEEESGRRERLFPDAASVSMIVTTPTWRLWERRRGTAAFLAVRVGVGDVHSSTRTVAGNGTTAPAGLLRSAPVTVSLAESSVGIAGPGAVTAGLVRWLLGQLAALHSPADLRLVLLLNRSRAESWLWLRWLEGHLDAVAETPTERAQVLDELARIYADRIATVSDARPWSGSSTVVLVDPAYLSAEAPIVDRLLRNGAEVGLSVVCVSEDYAELPASCGTILRFGSGEGPGLEVSGRGRDRQPVIAERVSQEWAEQLARSLSPLRDGEMPASAKLPDRVELAELLDARAPSPEGIIDRWADGRPTTPIGTSTVGPVMLDLEQDGPHLLVAGTTGSGKSELLKTLVTGLACGQPPAAMSFVLIDYKGGAAFAGSSRLPHVLGTVTDLDEHLTRRALICLNAELRRREKLFSEAEVADLRDYRCQSTARLHPLARLVIVVDEFAALAEELPDFLDGLLAVAQRGRSLGVHLVLATQRPAGVLSQNIKANISLRIALRVTDPAESIDVVGDDSASTISPRNPGRAILHRAGHEPVEFQSAVLGQVSHPASRATTISVLDRWNRDPAPAYGTSQPDFLDSLLVPMHSLLDRFGPVPPSPWLPPLPSSLSVPPHAGSRRIALGLTDHPAAQQQSTEWIDLGSGGVVGFVGGPRSGRSTALRSVAGRAVGQLSADDLHLYVLDFAGSDLLGFARTPHCATMVASDEPAAAGRLLALLLEELSRRQSRQTTATGNGRVQDPTPILVLLDGWENFATISEEFDGGRTADNFIQLLREGPAAGFTLLVSGDRSVLGVRIASAVTRKYLLPMGDRTDYAIAGLPVSSVTDHMVAGRAIAVPHGEELQIATLVDDPAPATQWAAVYQSMVAVPRINPPTVVLRRLPKQLTLDALDQTCTNAANDCILGAGGDAASTISWRFFGAGERFLVAGPARSGKSNVAVLVAIQAQKRGLTLLLAAARRSPLAKWAKIQGIPTYGPQDSLPDHEADVIIVDDVELFTDSLAGDRLLNRLREQDLPVIATGRSEDLLLSFRGLGAELRRYRTGLLLRPSPGDGELLGARLGHGVQTDEMPGRGFLVTEETRRAAPGHLMIQVAQC